MNYVWVLKKQEGEEWYVESMHDSFIKASKEQESSAGVFEIEKWEVN